MEWITEALQARNKSVVNNAKLAHRNMLEKLEHQRVRLLQLERVVGSYESVCLDALQADINRLERHRKELLLDLDTTETALAERKKKMNETKALMASLKEEGDGSRSNPDTTGTGPLAMTSSSSSSRGMVGHASAPVLRHLGGSSASGRLSHRTHDSNHNGSYIPSAFNLTLVDRSAYADDELEMDYIEENEMLDSIREILSPQHVLLIIQRSDVDDILICTPSSIASEVVCMSKLSDDSGRVPPSPINHIEAKFGLEAAIVPNHERDFPDVYVMQVPEYIAPTLVRFFEEKQQVENIKGSSRSESIGIEGTLIGAVEIPAVEDVVIDVWRVEGLTWATTTVGDVKFAVLERIFVTCDFSLGKPNVSQIDMFARHPETGHIVEETIMRVPTDS